MTEIARKDGLRMSAVAREGACEAHGWADDDLLPRRVVATMRSPDGMIICAECLARALFRAVK